MNGILSLLVCGLFNHGLYGLSSRMLTPILQGNKVSVARHDFFKESWCFGGAPGLRLRCSDNRAMFSRGWRRRNSRSRTLTLIAKGVGIPVKRAKK